MRTRPEISTCQKTVAPGQCFEVVTFEDDGKGDCLLRNDAGEPVQRLVVCALTLRLALIVACSWQPA